MYLTTTNALADRINQERAKEFPGGSLRLEGELSDGFDVKILAHAPRRWNLKTGAQVMLLNNDPAGKWVNGTIGKIFSSAKDHEATARGSSPSGDLRLQGGTIRVALASGLIVEVALVHLGGVPVLL